jgi:hypothetical protein
MGKQYWVLSLFQVLKNKLFSFVNIMDENINFMCSIQVLDSFLKGSILFLKFKMFLHNLIVKVCYNEFILHYNY